MWYSEAAGALVPGHTWVPPPLLIIIKLISAATFLGPGGWAAADNMFVLDMPPLPRSQTSHYFGLTDFNTVEI